jgi:NADP-dependent 3-hydroxy acid dehydrogenase YdfG
MIDVNLRGTLYVIAAVLPHFHKRGSGHIVNVSSVSGQRVDPTAAVYSATKFAVRALSEGLRQESRDIRVTVVSPGFTQSELTDHGGSPDAQGRRGRRPDNWRFRRRRSPARSRSPLLNHWSRPRRRTSTRPRATSAQCW